MVQFGGQQEKLKRFVVFVLRGSEGMMRCSFESEVQNANKGERGGTLFLVLTA